MSAIPSPAPPRDARVETAVNTIRRHLPVSYGVAHDLAVDLVKALALKPEGAR